MVATDILVEDHKHVTLFMKGDVIIWGTVEQDGKLPQVRLDLTSGCVFFPLLTDAKGQKKLGPSKPTKIPIFFAFLCAISLEQISQKEKCHFHLGALHQSPAPPPKVLRTLKQKPDRSFIGGREGRVCT